MRKKKKIKINKTILIVGLAVLLLIIGGLYENRNDRVPTLSAEELGAEEIVKIVEGIFGSAYNAAFGSAYIEGTPYYLAAAATNEVITTQPAVLHKMIIGKSVASSEINISDHDTLAAGNTKFYFAGDSLVGSHPLDTYFSEGITVTTTAATNVTFIYSPR